MTFGHAPGPSGQASGACTGSSEREIDCSWDDIANDGDMRRLVYGGTYQL